VLKSIRRIFYFLHLGKKRVSVFIDGFNVYHFLDKTANLNKYKWLDYRKLAECFLPPRSTITSIYYFTAFAKWRPDKLQRHKLYIRALRTRGIKEVIGKFKPVKRMFVYKDNSSNKIFKTRDGEISGRIKEGYTFEEKKTDVNIAIFLLNGAFKNEFDTALIISGDTDFEPAIANLRSNFPHKEIIVVVPNRNIAGSLRYLAGKRNCFSLEEKNLKASQLDDPIILPNGKKITKPSNWV
jgi:uncharacterized LabA/DUF88 family protein